MRERSILVHIVVPKLLPFLWLFKRHDIVHKWWQSGNALWLPPPVYFWRYHCFLIVPWFFRVMAVKMGLERKHVRVSRTQIRGAFLLWHNFLGVLVLLLRYENILLKLLLLLLPKLLQNSVRAQSLRWSRFQTDIKLDTVLIHRVHPFLNLIRNNPLYRLLPSHHIAANKLL